MATTGLWPVKCRLKDVLDYADNPDKTTAQKYLDRDLYATLTCAGMTKRQTNRYMLTLSTARSKEHIRR